MISLAARERSWKREEVVLQHSNIACLPGILIFDRWQATAEYSAALCHIVDGDDPRLFPCWDGNIGHNVSGVIVRFRRYDTTICRLHPSPTAGRARVLHTESDGGCPGTPIWRVRVSTHRIAVWHVPLFDNSKTRGPLVYVSQLHVSQLGILNNKS